MTEAITGSLIGIDEEVLGATVANPTGDVLGTVDDLILDSATGRVVYALMSFGGLLGLGTQYFPIPWELFTHDTANSRFTVDLDKTRLETAPRHGTESEWTRRFASEIDSFYGIQRPLPATE